MKIDATEVLTPTALKVDIYDIDGESYRNANGDMLRDRVTTKRKISCKWDYLTTEQMSYLLTLVKPVFFTVEYLDPETGTVLTKTFYVGDRSAPVYSYALGLWTDLSMNFIER